MEVSGQFHTPAALPPEKQHPLPTGQEAGWAPEPVWTLWKGEKLLVSVRNRTPDVSHSHEEEPGTAVMCYYEEIGSE
jgi:hypothetical protein